MTPKELAKQLRNIGPICAKELLDVGIDSLEKLKELGAKKAYEKICAQSGYESSYHAAYLYALEGAILDCDWRHIPAAKKEEYKALTSSLRKQKQPTPSPKLRFDS